MKPIPTKGVDHPCPRTGLASQQCDCGAERHVRIRQTRTGSWNAETISGRVWELPWSAFVGGSTAEGARQATIECWGRRGVRDIVFLGEFPHPAVPA